MPVRFLHLCGPSGVGKKTLVRKLIEDSVPGLRARFGVDRPFGAYGLVDVPGMEAMWKYSTAPEEIVIHNWQLASHGWIAHNKLAHPSVTQSIYLLWQPYRAHSDNIRARAERAPKGTDVHEWRPKPHELEDQWRDLFVPMFREVERWGLAVEMIDASTELCDPKPDWPA